MIQEFSKKGEKMLKREIMAVIKERGTLEFIGDIIGAVSLFGILFVGMFAALIWG